jgi:nucleoid-associated protein YgaU
MGQLEKYGLYVLCLLIFLIVGVSIWGDPMTAASIEQKPFIAKLEVTPPIDLNKMKVRPADISDVEKIRAADPISDVEKIRAADPQVIHEYPQVIEPKPIEIKKVEPVVVAKSETYLIKEGDNYETIARKKLGDARLASMLVEMNPTLPPTRLQIGNEIQLPTKAQLEAKKAQKPVVIEPIKDVPPAKNPAPAKNAAPAKKVPDQKAGTGFVSTASRTHKIEPNDTFQGLSKRLLGSDKRVDELKALNPSIDPTRLRPGQVINLPSK